MKGWSQFRLEDSPFSQYLFGHEDERILRTMFCLYLVVSLIATIFHIVTRYGRRGRLLRNIPGPTAYPFLGNTIEFNYSCLNKFWEKVRETTNKYYPITRFWICSTAVVSVRHPYDLEILLSSQKVIEKGYVYDYFRPWLKNGLLTSTGYLWHQRRKILTPAFHFNILQMYTDIANEESRKAVIELKANGKSSIECLTNFCSKYTMNVICESAMGVKLRNIDKQSVDDYRKAVHDMSNIIVYRLTRPYIQTWMMPFVYKWGSFQKNALKCLHSFSKKIVEERMEYHKRNNYKLFIDQAADSENQDSKKRLSMLDILLLAERNNEIDLDGVHEEVDTFTFEGHDTTGMGLVYTLLLLAEHKEEQDKCRDEAIELLDRIKGNIRLSNLRELSHLERCIKESLRLYPPVATLQRYTPVDLKLKHALVPADTHIVIHLYDTHRDPNFWTEPDKFLPSRFLPENSRNRHPFAYVPFSAGPRNCIGQKFALMEMKTLIAQLLYDFYLAPVDRLADLKITAGMVIKPLKQVRIKFISIKKDKK